MNINRNAGPNEPDPNLSQLSCSACAAYALNVCQAAALAPWAAARAKPVSIHQSAHTAPARRIVCRAQDLHDAVPLICSGWAASIVMLPDGSRQILSFLLPGDIVSMALLFEPARHCLVEAVSDVRYRMFTRSELKTMLFRHPAPMEIVAKAWVEEKARADRLIVDLGRRTADERIARLALDLAERLGKRGMTQGEPGKFDFPLRQHHIADATGLTPVHVSKVLSGFRRRKLMTIGERTLTILDPDGLRRLAHLRRR